MLPDEARAALARALSSEKLDGEADYRNPARRLDRGPRAQWGKKNATSTSPTQG